MGRCTALRYLVPVALQWQNQNVAFLVPSAFLQPGSGYPDASNASGKFTLFVFGYLPIYNAYQVLAQSFLLIPYQDSIAM